MNLERAEQLAFEKMELHGLSQWALVWTNATTAYGNCCDIKRTIYLSSILTAIVDELHVLDTILHEIAHALVGCYNGHNEVWQKKAKEIGCNGNTTCNRVISDNDLPPKWVMLFKGKIVKRYFRRPNKKTFNELPYLELQGMPETLGNLKLIEYKDYVK